MIAAPSLVEFGILPIAAHMFVFYSCLLSALTPPVALAAYAGAAIAEADVMKTSVIAAMLGFVKYVVPYVFVYNAALLMEGSAPFIISSFATAFLGTVFMSAALSGFLLTRLSPPWRATLFVGSILLLISELATDVIGLALVTLVLIVNRRYHQREKHLQVMA